MKKIRNKPASILARLKNVAQANDIDYNAILILYMQERFLYRLAVSPYADNFVLKGGLLLFSIDHFNTRPTFSKLGEKSISPRKGTGYHPTFVEYQRTRNKLVSNQKPYRFGKITSAQLFVLNLTADNSIFLLHRRAYQYYILIFPRCHFPAY
jgi:hypothetical protein